MKIKILVIISLFLMFSNRNYAQCDANLISLLKEYYSLATTSADRNLYKGRFFEIFPNNFQLLDSLYGWDETKDFPRPLYSEATSHIDLFFDTFGIVDKDTFVKKVINISINGRHSADAINWFQQNLRGFFSNNTELFLKTLESYTDIKIKSFWHFFFDNFAFGHFVSLENYKEVYERIKQLNFERILTLMQEQYTHDYNESLERFENMDCCK